MKQFFKDANGEFSSTRLLMLVVLLLLSFDWIYSIVAIGSYPISWEKVALISTVFGLKGLQSFAENKDATTTQTTQIKTTDKIITQTNTEEKKEVDG